MITSHMAAVSTALQARRFRPLSLPATSGARGARATRSQESKVQREKIYPRLTEYSETAAPHMPLLQRLALCRRNAPCLSYARHLQGGVGWADVRIQSGPEVVSMWAGSQVLAGSRRAVGARAQGGPPGSCLSLRVRWNWPRRGVRVRSWNGSDRRRSWRKCGRETIPTPPMTD